MKRAVRTRRPVINTRRQTASNITADFEHLAAIMQAAVDRQIATSTANPDAEWDKSESD